MSRLRVFKSGTLWGVKADGLILGRFTTHSNAIRYANIIARQWAV